MLEKLFVFQLFVSVFGKHRCCGLVEFASSNEAKKALRKKNGKYLCDRKIFLEVAKMVPSKYFIDHKSTLVKVFGIHGEIPRVFHIPGTKTIFNKANVYDAANLTGWAVRGHQGRQHQSLLCRIRTEPLPRPKQGKDVVMWRHSDDDYKDHFSAKKKHGSKYDQRKQKSHGVKLFGSHMGFQAIKNRLATGDRMRKWGFQQDCVFCGEKDETRDHILFACPYTYTVWERLIGRLLGPNTTPD
ncbi:unnamed protein product [Arabis nemorensis]|uniref:Reverse transcriptase zinc-binding domain-containing protein n=1 Tax=Arabis nemorensis TaxID=586526 RepID=A0A565BLZ8_9BRAS|nr:unnamed protein product [Arabis nemorensis]